MAKPLEALAVPEPGKCGPSSALIERTDGSKFCIDTYELPNIGGIGPEAALGGRDVAAMCEHIGKRICTEDEWTIACKGAREWRRFPYGNIYQVSRCVDDKRWRQVDWSLMANITKWAEHADSLYQAEPGGRRLGCVTPEGVHDLVGNVAEWVLSPRSRYGFVLKGCYWSGCYGQPPPPPDCDFTNPAHPPEFRTYEAGGRCCRSLH